MLAEPDLAWIAKYRRNPDEQVERVLQIPELMQKLFMRQGVG